MSHEFGQIDDSTDTVLGVLKHFLCQLRIKREEKFKEEQETIIEVRKHAHGRHTEKRTLQEEKRESQRAENSVSAAVVGV